MLLNHPKQSEMEWIDTIAHWLIGYFIAIFLILTFVIPSPWGKAFNTHKYWFLGPLIPAKAAWMFFESPNLFWSVICWYHRRNHVPLINVGLASLFVGHYIRRAIVYPLQMSSGSKPIPLVTVLSAFAFCTVNG
jgi:3-oxo-5-alpha-steroid 4-dehydrogenase 1